MRRVVCLFVGSSHIFCTHINYEVSSAALFT